MKYTEEQLSFLRKNRTQPRAKLTELFNQAFKTNKSVKAINTLCKRHKFLTGRTGQFVFGQKSWNKGTKGYTVANKTSFKKGNIPKNYRPVGSERITKDGYIEVKIADPKTWRLKHIHEWEKVNGKLPKGYCLSFLDGDKQNIELSNLKLISRLENHEFNRKGYSTYPNELRPILRNITAIDLTVRNKLHSKASNH